MADEPLPRRLLADGSEGEGDFDETLRIRSMVGPCSPLADCGVGDFAQSAIAQTAVAGDPLA